MFPIVPCFDMARIIILEKQKHVTKNQTAKGTDNMGNDKKLNEQTMLSEQELKDVNGAGEPTDEYKNDGCMTPGYSLTPGYSMSRDYCGALAGCNQAIGIPAYAKTIKK